jgi:sugar phosphate permease
METAAVPPRGLRWRVPLVLGVTMFVNYLDRNNLALALPRIAQDFGWSDREIGTYGQFLLAAFFLAFGVSNSLFSPAAERFGPKRSVLIALTAFSICTMLNAPLGQTLAALIVLRLLLGVGEGVHIPMLSALTSRWFPAGERSRANAIWNAGILIATAFAPLAIVPAIDAIGWRLTFAALGLIGLLISVPLVALVVHDDPRQQPGISQAELDYIEAGRDAPLADDGSDPQHYARDRRFWLAVLGGALNAFCAFGILNWLPTYFTRAKGLDFEALGWPLAFVFAAGIAGIVVMAYLGDKLNQRALLASGGFLIGAAAVFLASRTSALPPLVALFAVAVFFQSAYQAQEYAIVQRLLPTSRVGAGTGLYNGLSVLFGGVGGSLIPGSIVAATGSFDRGILSIVGGALLASAVMFTLSRLIRY